MTNAVRTGDTIRFRDPPCISAFAAVGGKRESEGPLAAKFDLLFEENTLGELTWEKAESRLQRYCLDLALKKGRCSPQMLDLVLGGDLQNQCTATGYTMRELDAPFAGLYGACSTMAEAMGLAAGRGAGGGGWRAAARAPSPTAQWTATAAGCCLVEPQGPGPYVRAVTFGRVRDYEICDINNMGAAMAPAAAETILRYCEDTGCAPSQFDAVYTGDLGIVGTRLLKELLEKEDMDLKNHRDCGLTLYDVQHQDVQAGGSGAGCSASVLCASVLPALQKGELNRVLFLSTGALMSQITFLQGESIPGVAHLVELSAGREEGE